MLMSSVTGFIVCSDSMTSCLFKLVKTGRKCTDFKILKIVSNVELYVFGRRRPIGAHTTNKSALVKPKKIVISIKAELAAISKQTFANFRVVKSVVHISFTKFGPQATQNEASSLIGII